MSIDEEGTSDTIRNRLRKLDRKMGEAERYWEELHKALSDPNYQPRPQPVTPRRQPSERHKSPRAKGKRSAEAEERRRRSDPLGFSRRRSGSSRSLSQDEGVEPPVRRGQGSISSDADRTNGSLDGSSPASSAVSPQENGVIRKETASLAHARPAEAVPVYENQYVGAGTRPKRSLLDVDLASPLCHPADDTPQQLQQVGAGDSVFVNQLCTLRQCSRRVGFVGRAWIIISSCPCETVSLPASPQWSPGAVQKPPCFDESPREVEKA